LIRPLTGPLPATCELAIGAGPIAVHVVVLSADVLSSTRDSSGSVQICRTDFAADARILRTPFLTPLPIGPSSVLGRGYPL